eukprot:4598996-Prymnesium_polylepis.1
MRCQRALASAHAKHVSLRRLLSATAHASTSLFDACHACWCAISPCAQFGALIQTVRNNQRDADRLRLIRNELVSYSVTCEQVAALLREIEFHDAKADAAAELYAGCVDREHYEARVITAGL